MIDLKKSALIDLKKLVVLALKKSERNSEVRAHARGNTFRFHFVSGKRLTRPDFPGLGLPTVHSPSED